MELFQLILTVLVVFKIFRHDISGNQTSCHFLIGLTKKTIKLPGITLAFYFTPKIDSVSRFLRQCFGCFTGLGTTSAQMLSL